MLILVITWGGYNKKQVQPPIIKTENHLLSKDTVPQESLPQDNDCISEVAHNLNQIGSIAAQGCPVNIK